MLGIKEITEGDVQKVFYNEYKHRFECITPNIMIEPKGSILDLVCIDGVTQSINEFEIKVSYADYLADFRKRICIDGKVIDKHEAVSKGKTVTNYFSFIITHEVSTKISNDCFEPKYGYYIARYDTLGTLRILEHKPPVMLHRRKVNALTKYNIACKLNLKYWELINGN